MRDQLAFLCQTYHLGILQKPPEPVTGGLLHQMYHVYTDRGEYAVKLLNPDIMKRPDALQNMICSELVSHKLQNIIPLVASKSCNGKHILKVNGTYYILFDWLDARSVFVPDITVTHCHRIGQLLGKMHAADIRVDGISPHTAPPLTQDWQALWERARDIHTECAALLHDNLTRLTLWTERARQGRMQIADHQVISHRDLDPKNVLWQGDHPFVIDWEAAGLVPPAQELIEVIRDWTPNAAGEYDPHKCDAILQAYAKHADLSKIPWSAAIDSGLMGSLGWFAYNLKRALGLEGTDARDRTEGLSQAIRTLSELNIYDTQMQLLYERIMQENI